MSKLFMMSEGDYSDYCVGGLYQSEHDVTEELLISKFNEYAGTLGVEHHFQWVNEADLKEMHIELITGEELRPEGIKACDDIWQRRCRLIKNYNELGCNVGDIDFYKWLCDTGFMNKIEYTEVHM